MRLNEVRLTNFRCFNQEIAVQIDELSALIGKNDAGKSTILDALQIALAQGKLDSDDVCVRAAADEEAVIECAFDELPDSLTLDAGSQTTLADEWLLDASGDLRIQWCWAISHKDGQRSVAGKPKLYALANHPVSGEVADLHAKKNTELKSLVKKLGLESDCELNNNASMRKVIWGHQRSTGDWELDLRKIDLAKEDGKKVWAQLENQLPLFVLFRSDRPSTDEDAEVQDPLKVAVKEAVAELADEIHAIKEKVKARSLTVARRTLEKLSDFDSDLASTLDPDFRAEPKWESIFKLSLTGDDGIPINKRGSGVRRLVLFSFFRAEAERLRTEQSKRNIIYGVEEPETSQHPNHQRMVVEAFRKLSEQDGCQVMLTTHVPGLAGLLPLPSLRLVKNSGQRSLVESGTEEVYDQVVASLGVIPDKRAQVLLCVEGPHDVAFLRNMCRLFRASGANLPCIESDPRIATVLLGGSTLQEWVNHHFLRTTGLPEFHLYDRDEPKPDGTFRYQNACEEVNGRGCGHSARLTMKREMENYLHPDAIERVLSPIVNAPVKPIFGDDDDVEKVVSSCILDDQGNAQKRVSRRSLKSWLNNEVAAVMTIDELKSRDPNEEILGWFKDIAGQLS